MVREVDTKNQFTRSRKSRSSARTPTLTGRNSQTIIGDLVEACYTLAWELKTTRAQYWGVCRGALCFHEFYFWESHESFRKILSCFWKYEGKSNHFKNISRAFCSAFLNKSLPLKETILPKLNRLGIYQNLTDLGDGKYPIPAPFRSSLT